VTLESGAGRPLHVNWNHVMTIGDVPETSPAG
jgi:hypothetical protein